MLKVSVVEADKNPEPVRAGQVRRGTDGSYRLVVSDGYERFNVIRISNGKRSISIRFAPEYGGYVSSDLIEREFPTVLYAELTIKGA